MKFKIKKDIFLKKSTWLVLGIFAITLVNIPRFRTQAAGTNDDLKFEPDTLKILEITPGNQSLLGNSKTYNDEVESGLEANGQKVQVTHMDMAKFISKVDDIEGEYDVVAITNEKNKDMPATFAQDKAYRQYSSPFNQSMDKTAYGANGQEYYPENDITNKRAKLIVDMINRGQLVYIDSSITNDSKLANTKLCKIFSGMNNANIKKVSASEITREKIVDAYKGLPQDNKRVKVMSATGPVSEDNTGNKVTNERMLNFSVNANAEGNEKLTFNFYLDFDGNGLYTGKPYFSQTVSGSSGYQKYDFSMPINNEFIGYLGWKVEIVRGSSSENKSAAKTSFTSYAVYHAQNGPKKIKVLQINPNSDDCWYFNNNENHVGTGKTKLTDSPEFMNLLKDPQVAKDYDISFNDITADEFNSKYSADGSGESLKNDYDMVIVGFADNYRGWNSNTGAEATRDAYSNNTKPADIDPSALKALDTYIAAGKSVMFTHDTIGLGVYGNSSGPKYFTQHYKDIVGQSRYNDPFRNGDASNIYTTLNDDGSEVKKVIPHDASNGNTLGQTALANSWASTQTNTVKNINNAQITTYPFDLRGYNNGDGTINVSLTHTQWYQLNLEDEDVVPWYNLVSTNNKCQIDSGDSRNFFYTYNKGNITYSGTGHSGVAKDYEQELRLFVNTIIKAERGSNAAPTVTNYKDENKDNKIENAAKLPDKIKTTEDYTFYTLPADKNNDKLDVNVEISTDGTNYKTIQSENSYTGSNLIKVVIKKSELENLEKGTKVQVRVTAKDPLNASGTSSFELTCSGNKPPDINNVNDNKPIADNEVINVSRQADFNFTSLLTDPDEEDKDKLKYSIKVDGSSSVAKLSKDGKEVSQDDSFTSEDKISVTLQDSVFDGKKTGDTIKIETTVTDSENQSKTKSFTLKIDAEDPNALLKVVNDVKEDGTFDEVSNDKTFKNDEIVKLAGKISNVYDPSGTISLEVPKELEVQGDITVNRLVNGKMVDLPNGYNKMVKSTDGTYTLDIEKANVLSLGELDKEGMTFIVQYNAKINDTDKVNDAIKNANSKKVEDGQENVQNEDGSMTTITHYKYVKDYKYDNTFISTLKFANSTSLANVYLHMDKNWNEKGPDDTNNIPADKNYINVDLF